MNRGGPNPARAGELGENRRAESGQKADGGCIYLAGCRVVDPEAAEAKGIAPPA